MTAFTAIVILCSVGVLVLFFRERRRSAQYAERIEYWRNEWEGRNDVVVALTQRLDAEYRKQEKKTC